MKINIRWIIIFLVVITVGSVLRFYQIESIPPGLNIDESSQGYNAFSLLNTGKDRYGQSWPVLFRSFGSFQAPLYTYLTVLPVYFFGNSIFAVRLVSILSGIILIIASFSLFLGFENRRKINLAIIFAVIIVISPWAIFFSRIGTEANLGVMLFALSFLLFYFSLRHVRLFPVATFILGLSTHAYYSERLISPLFLIGFIYIFRKIIFPQKKLLIIGLAFFILTQIPHTLIANTGAFTRRITQVSYFSDQFVQNNSKQLYYFPFGKIIFIIREFSSQYFAYFSPRNLFSDPDPQPERSIPELSVFYKWMIVPLVVGMVLIFKRRSTSFSKIILLAMLIAPIPAALTRDPFHTIRALILLWILSLIITIGVEEILNKISSVLFKHLLILSVLLYSFVLLYISYFILLKYERKIFDYAYIQILEKVKSFPNQTFIVDSSRQLANGVRYAFLKRTDPSKLQKSLETKVVNQYYGVLDFTEPYTLDNIEARPIIWREDICKKQILVGDLLAISPDQVQRHNLQFLFNVKNLAGDIVLKAYLTNPDAKCNTILPQN